MNRRSFIFALAGTAAMSTITLASGANEEPKRKAAEGRMAYPYNKYTLHRIKTDEFGLQLIGREDETIRVLSSVITPATEIRRSGAPRDYSYVVIKDGLPVELLTSEQVIMIPRSVE